MLSADLLSLHLVTVGNGSLPSSHVCTITTMQMILVLFFLSSLDVIGIGFEREVYVDFVPENVGIISVCIVTNVTLRATRTASAVLQTQDVSAEG